MLHLTEPLEDAIKRQQGRDRFYDSIFRPRKLWDESDIGRRVKVSGLFRLHSGNPFGRVQLIRVRRLDAFVVAPNLVRLTLYTKPCDNPNANHLPPGTLWFPVTWNKAHPSLRKATEEGIVTITAKAVPPSRTVMPILPSSAV